MKTQTIRKKGPKKKNSDGIELEALCKSLLKERNQALRALEQVRAENKSLRYNLHKLMDKDYGKPIDKEKLLAEAVPFPIDDFILDLKRHAR